MSKHTPGPWKVSGLARSIRDASGRAVCKVCSEGVLAEATGNARLIAAAPDLLEAAQWVLRSAGYENGQAEPTLQALSVNRTYLDNLRDAIAKAEGQSSASKPSASTADWQEDFNTRR